MIVRGKGRIMEIETVVVGMCGCGGRAVGWKMIADGMVSVMKQ